MAIEHIGLWLAFCALGAAICTAMYISGIRQKNRYMSMPGGIGAHFLVAVMVILMYHASLTPASEKVATCSNCSAQIEIIDKYCSQCGESQPCAEQSDTPHTTQHKDATNPEKGEQE